MTGFGEAFREDDGISVGVEVSSVNSRHHNINVNLPDFPKFQQKVERRVRNRVERGKIDVQFNSNVIGKREESVEIDRDMIEFYTDQAAQLSDRYAGVNDTIDVSELFELPGVIKLTREPVLNDRAQELFIDVLESALDELIEMRVEEGKAIAGDLRDRIGEIRSLLNDIEERIPEALDRYRSKLLEDIDDVLSLSDEETEERLENELKMYADKCDISEEVVRISSHLDQFETYLDQDGAVGKSLEFLIQEIQREINTVGAKANDADISQLSVDVKNELEKCREQVKNVE